MPFDFTGKTALVTGGANGIGLAAARAMAACGARIILGDLEREHPAEAAREFGGQGIVLDVSDPESLAAAIDGIPALDILVANAGTVFFGGLTEHTDEMWQRTLAVNLSGVFYTIRAAARVMMPRRGGAIVITASTNSYDGEAQLAAYNATKHGVLGILHTAANELGPYGIRVNAVCPGLIRTRLTVPFFSQPDLLREYFRQIPLGRGGEPEEVGTAIAFLASNLASYITGAALLVDGGQMACKFGPWSESTADFVTDRWKLR
jgi:NAD(P)-dependent dehydrogenase (short-subunit alcohol dehydrogenase family)